jgi:protein TonB
MTVEGGDDFVLVEPAGADVRVRAVHVASVNAWCPWISVEAMERVLPRTTVRAVVGIPVCDVADREVLKAVKRAPDYQGYVDFIGRIDAVIAECGGTTREFAFQMPPMIDAVKLRRQDPRVAAVRDLGTRLRALVTGGADDAYDPFDQMSAADRPAREALGTALVPALLRGQYAPLLTPMLTGYAGPPARREPDFVEVVGREALVLDSYVEPVMPQIAKSARVFGDVRVALAVDPATGRITTAAILKSVPLLDQAALDALRQWRFRTSAIPADPVAVTVRFAQPACAAEAPAAPAR